jgi:hypothetical protein
MKSKHCAHSVPAESKRRTNFDLLGLAVHIHSEEAVRPLLGKPRVGLLPPFLIIGGYGVRDIIAGKLHESQISPLVIKAFHSQYPHAGDFVDFVRDHKGDASLLGIINGIKGKVFELEYLDYLNDGHLPAGAVAELATSPTQEGWDIAIRDSTGHVIEHLQLKATESMSFIADAIANHPEIDVVATHEVFEHMDDPEILSHLVDSGISNAQLEDGGASGPTASWRR